VSTVLLAAPGEDGGFHVPSIAEFFPPAILFEGTVFELNRIMLIRLLVTVVLCTLFVLAARSAQLVPRRGQNVAEIALDFVRVNIAEEILGEKHARPHVPLLTVIFFGVLGMNITGVIPGLNIAASSLIGFPLVMAALAYAAFIAAGIRSHGVVGFVRNSLFPAGVPWPVYIILTPIELISTFILRPATLTIRLLVNMVAGHLLLVLCFASTHYLFLEAATGLKAIGVVTLAAGVAFTVFEIFIAALQAYIFTLLTAVYIHLSQEAH
jgi:F-type H+-transporting ATPase subunit a